MIWPGCRIAVLDKVHLHPGQIFPLLGVCRHGILNSEIISIVSDGLSDCADVLGAVDGAPSTVAQGAAGQP
jgi:hypothetical protein